MTRSDVYPIDSDLMCMHCGYSLRGLTSDGVCPECGQFVQDSVANGQQLKSPPSRILLSFRAGGVILIMAMLALRVVPRFVYVGGYPNGVNPNSWWWEVIANLGLINILWVFFGFALLAWLRDHRSSRIVMTVLVIVLCLLLVTCSPLPFL